MAIFDDPLEELKRLEKQLLQEEEEEDDEDYDEEYDEEYEEEEEDEPAPSPSPARSNRGLIVLALLELAGIGLIAAWWLGVFR